MNGELRIHNWGKWQSYRADRGQPPWIKVHRCLMRNTEWVSLTDAQRGQLVGIWLLAADRDGVIPASPRLIQKLCYMDSEPDLELFISLRFIDSDADVTPCRRQDDSPETETETETETEEYCAEPETDSAPKPAAFIRLPLNDGSQHPVELDEVTHYRELFPAVDIEQELRNMLAWLESNPTRKKTRSGVKRFITGWLSREQDTGRRNGGTRESNSGSRRSSSEIIRRNNAGWKPNVPEL